MRRRIRSAVRDTRSIGGDDECVCHVCRWGRGVDARVVAVEEGAMSDGREEREEQEKRREWERQEIERAKREYGSWAR